MRGVAGELTGAVLPARLRADAGTIAACAVQEFWNELEDSGAPIVEPTPGEAGHSLFAFVWRGSPRARNAIRLLERMGFPSEVVMSAMTYAAGDGGG